MTKLTIPALALSALTFAGCAAGASEPTAATTTAPTTVAPVRTVPAAPKCAEVLAEGAPIPTLKTLSAACTDEAGSTHVYGAASLTCLDGRVLAWNERGWGYVGSTFHTGVTMAPATEREACKPSS
jgi:hypothetical protein